MATKFFQIEIQLEENKIFKFTPVEYIYIDSPARRVVIYNLNYFDLENNENNLESQIPYYISDGHTNHFRANMLYPFICFLHENSIDSCPFDAQHLRLPNGGLIKLNIGQNFENTQIHDWIKLELIKGKYPEPLYELLKTTSRNKTVGVLSVLPRIQNILDYFIAVICEPILNVKHYKNYRPVFTPGQEYNIDHIDEPVVPENYKVFENLRPFKFNDFLAIGDFYRSKLVVALNDQVKHFIRYGILHATEIVLEPYQLSMQVFNQTVGICNREPKNPDNKISFSSIANVSAYSLISDNLHQQLITRVEVEIGSADPVRNNFFGTLNGMLKRIPIYNADEPDNLLPNIVNGWNARCYYKKYLKYANSRGISLEQVFYEKYLLYDLNKNSNPSLNTYKNKYLKYKNKYLQLKNKL